MNNGMSISLLINEGINGRIKKCSTTKRQYNSFSNLPFNDLKPHDKDGNKGNSKMTDDRWMDGQIDRLTDMARRRIVSPRLKVKRKMEARKKERKKDIES